MLVEEGGSEWNPVLRASYELGCRLVDEHGRPHVGLTVALEPTDDPNWWRGADGAFALYGLARTDDDGRFRVRGCSPGAHSIEVRTPLGPGSWLPCHAEQGVVSGAPWERTIPRAETVHIAMSLIVATVQGEPVHGARVSWERADGSWSRRLGPASFLSDAEGRATFPSARAVPYRVTVEHPGFETRVLEVDVGGADQAAGRHDCGTVALSR